MLLLETAEDAERGHPSIQLIQWLISLRRVGRFARLSSRSDTLSESGDRDEIDDDRGE